MIVKTGVSIGTAVGASVLMISFGIDLWFTWALLTFLFNYVPYIGSVFAMIPPLILGAVMLGRRTADLCRSLHHQPAGVATTSKTAGRPRPRRLPLVLLLVTSYSFWLWGLVGMILAVPFAVLVKIVLENVDATRPVAILLSERAPSLDEAWKMRCGTVSFLRLRVVPCWNCNTSWITPTSRWPSSQHVHPRVEPCDADASAKHSWIS